MKQHWTVLRCSGSAETTVHGVTTWVTLLYTDPGESSESLFLNFRKLKVKHVEKYFDRCTGSQLHWLSNSPYQILDISCSESVLLQ